MTELKVQQMMNYYKKTFIMAFEEKNGKNPHPNLVKYFVNEIIYSDKFNTSPRYSEEYNQKVLAYVLSLDF